MLFSDTLGKKPLAHVSAPRNQPIMLTSSILESALAFRLLIGVSFS